MDNHPKGSFFSKNNKWITIQQECDMTSSMRNWFENFFDIAPQDRLKVLFLSIFYFLIVAAYTIARELKDSIFIGVVGKDYIPIARIMVMFGLVPAILLYSRLVDSMRRGQLFMWCSIFFGVGNLCIAYFLGHSTIGIGNTDASPYRIFGWLVYFFGEGYAPFLVSVLWAFINSVTTPDGAKRAYPLIVACSKIGGMLAAGWAWYFMGVVATRSALSDAFTHQVCFGLSTILLMVVPVCVWLMLRVVPSKNMHGYEAAYQAEKKHEGEHVGVFSGLTLMAKYPYVLGIFSMIFFYEIVGTVMSLLRLTVAREGALSLSESAAVQFKIVFPTHAVGLLFILLGTRLLLQKLGERVCLMLVPLLTGGPLLGYLLYPGHASFQVAYAAFKAINYAFSWPVRESLYIPTIRDIRYKSRSWIDAFGSKFARGGGSVFNLFIGSIARELVMTAYSFFFAGIVGIWFVAAWLVGKRFEYAIENNEVIGLDKKNDN